MRGRLLTPILLALAACGPAARSLTTQERREQAAVGREIALTRRAGPGVIRLEGGSCLTLARVAMPWTLFAAPEPTEFARVNSAVIWISAAGFGLRPYERAGFAESFAGVPHDGRLRVHVDGTSPGHPWRESHALVPDPARLDDGVRTGMLRRFQPWPGAPLGLQGYADRNGLGRRYFADPGQRIRCEDEVLPDEQRRLGWLPEGICRVGSARAPRFNFAFSFDARDLPHLPDALTRIEAAVDATRGACPPQRQVAGPRR